jgi:nicotinate-nucleotide adenylyltransferase
MAYVGILGGTFDPIHYGHLAAAEGVLHRLGLERVYFMPNRQPPHKEGRRVTPAEHRAAMVRLAIAGNPRFAYLGVELDRQGPSYTIDTVRELLRLHPDWRIAFVVGMDSLLQIATWREYESLLRLVELVAVNRPGFALPGVKPVPAPEAGAPRPLGPAEAALLGLPPELAARIRLVEIPGVAVASTDLRRLAGEGYPLRYLVPPEVERYIVENRLYGEEMR